MAFGLARSEERPTAEPKQQDVPLKPTEVIYITANRDLRKMYNMDALTAFLLVCAALPPARHNNSAAQVLAWSPRGSFCPPNTPRPPSRLHPTQTDSCTNSLHCKKLNHTSF